MAKTDELTASPKVKKGRIKSAGRGCRATTRQHLLTGKDFDVGASSIDWWESWCRPMLDLTSRSVRLYKERMNV